MRWPHPRIPKRRLTSHDPLSGRHTTDNPTWGYRRITGELKRASHNAGASTVWRILKQHTIDPSPNRADVTWTQFLRSQAAVACDFATIDTAFLHRYYLLFVIDITSREAFFAGITKNPTGAWTTQAARNLFLTHAERLEDARALVRDRGSQFVQSFDEIFRTEGMKILKTPARTPVANTFAERWIGTLRRELLDRTIIWNQRQLQRIVAEYITHYNQHRPHRSLDQQPPRPTDTHRADAPDTPRSALQIVRDTRCDGLINEIQNSRLTWGDRVLGTHTQVQRNITHPGEHAVSHEQAAADTNFAPGTSKSICKRHPWARKRRIPRPVTWGNVVSEGRLVP